MAAFVERTLPAAEALAFEQHAAGCARCQQALAVLATLPLEAPPTAEATSAPARWSQWFDWRWLVPLGAVAGLAIAVYVAVRPAPPSGIDVAGGAGVSGAAPEAEALAPAAPKSMAASEVTASPAADAEGQASVMAGPAPPASPPVGRSRQAAAPVVASAEAPSPAEAPPSTVTPPRADRRAADAANLAEAGAALEMARAQRIPPGEDVSRQPAPAAQVAQVAASPAPAPLVAGSAPAPPSDVAPAPAPAPGALPAAGAGPPGQAKAAYATGVAAVRWRVAPGGRLERTTDAGRSWQPQATGVTADLLAAATVSARVAWAVGAAGTVLRTTDGERWEPCAAPVEGDLVAVAAISATHAVVTARDGRRHATSDGGRTWRPAP